MPRQKGQANKRNVVLQIKTYERLENFKIELVNKKKKANITFDEAIDALLDEHYIDDRAFAVRPTKEKSKDE